ncbi:hypothetical protein [Pasteuria penetrans]|uniref:hypothetical protein n=1 Tax=Pasteuria penetrans TaxID=86005 RepID=UPI0011EE9B25|nr:hypothetical protein [Pasteuria penetrans]
MWSKRIMKIAPFFTIPLVSLSLNLFNFKPASVSYSGPSVDVGKVPGDEWWGRDSDSHSFIYHLAPVEIVEEGVRRYPLGDTVWCDAGDTEDFSSFR